MKFLLLPVLVAFLAVAQVYCEENEPKEETDYWTSSNEIQVMYSRDCFIIEMFWSACVFLVLIEVAAGILL